MKKFEPKYKKDIDYSRLTKLKDWWKMVSENFEDLVDGVSGWSEKLLAFLEETYISKELKTGSNSEYKVLSDNNFTDQYKKQVDDGIKELKHIVDLNAIVVGGKLDSWATVQEIVRSGEASKYFNIGDQFICNHNIKNLIGTSTTETIVWDIVGIDHDIPIDENYTHSITLQAHYATNTEFKFTVQEALYYCENELPAGTYCITAYDVDYTFTTTSVIPAGALLFATYSGTTLKSIGVCPSWTTPTTTGVTTITATKGSTGTHLGVGEDAVNLNKSDNSRGRNAVWKDSYIRGMLNKTTPDGLLNKFQAICYSVGYPFLYGLDDDFLNVIGTVRKTTNGVDTEDKIFLPSSTEIYGGGTDGVPYAYYVENSTLTEPSVNADSNRIKNYVNTSYGTTTELPAQWLLRSETTVGAVDRVKVDGSITDRINPTTALRIAPMCVIW